VEIATMTKQSHHLKRRLRAAAAGAAWLTVTCAAFGSAEPFTEPAAVPVAVPAAAPAAAPEVAPEAARTEERPVKEPAAAPATGFQLAQFQLPQGFKPGEAIPLPGERRPRLLRGDLSYQYSLGSESDISFRKNPDLNRRVQDNLQLLSPQLNGYITYRPTNWLDMTLEMILEQEIATQENKVLPLPNGETRIADKHRTSILVDQAFMTFKHRPFDLTVGRKNFEDDRHWIYDTSLDVVMARFSQGVFLAEASMSRKDKWDLDLNRSVPRGQIDNYMLHMTYRGIEDVKLNGYVIKLHDRAPIKTEGRPLIIGANVLGTPSRELSYWAEYAQVRGHDELRQKLSGYAYDAGATYRFSNVPLRPNITLGYAFGSGDSNPNDTTNHAFRQTGLQSNESRFAGVSKFKTYGEALDPELSNLKILTAGIGFQPAQNVTADLVFHSYRLHKLGVSEDIRNSPITAQLNQVAGRESKDVGKEVDIVLGFRQLFGIRRLGLDLRMGVLFPGNAFVTNEGTTRRPAFRYGDKSYSVLAKFWYTF
jgi:alginate production protein